MTGTVVNSQKVRWAEEQVLELKALWAKGFSAGRISQKMPQFTRNAVIGKAHRLGLESRKQAPSQNPRQIVTRKERVAMTTKFPALRIVAPETPPPRPEGDLIPFMKADSRTCRSVEGHSDKSGLAMFCPAPKDPNQSFCAYHHSIYYPRPTR